MNRARRVAVTSPQTRVALARRRTHPGRRHRRLTPTEAELARRVRGRQLRWALVTLGLGCLLLVGLPVLLATVPGLAELRLGGMPLTWLAVAVLPYPVLVGLAAWQLRRAERIESDTR